MKLSDKLKLFMRFPITLFQQGIYKKPFVMDDLATLNYIVERQCSIARFGDGELDLMCGIGIKFQKADRKLRKRLKEIAKSESPNCLICLPDVFEKNLHDKYLKKDADWWQKCLLFTRGIWYKHFRAKKYGDATISRFYMALKDKTRTAEYVESIRKIWDNRDIVFVEGERSRLGVGNDLFDNAKSIRRIICPGKDAFAAYDKIFKQVMLSTSDNDLIICALGPTATVLSYDLSQNNRRALDLGHIDVEYEWFLLGATQKVSIAGKDVAESTNDLRDAQTQSADGIIAVID